MAIQEPAVFDVETVFIVLVCDEGYSSSLAEWILQQLGLVNATDLRGGFQAWAAVASAASPRSSPDHGDLS